jgi:ribose/xylose/arabinose/galactoside ABC-type transport system permease subunit
VAIRIGKLIASWPALGAAAALAVLLLANALLTPGFAQIELRDGRLYGAVVDILRNGSVVVLLAVGMSLVIATAGVDLSVGSVMALAGAVAALGLTEHSLSPTAALACGLAVGTAAGLFSGVLVTFVRIQPIIATLVMLVAARGLAQVLTQDQKVRFESPAFEWLASGAVAGIPVPVLLAAGTALVVAALLRFTVAGLYIHAVGDNPRAAYMCGLPIHRVHLFVYGMSGLCAGLAGMLAAAEIKEADVAGSGLFLELDAILAVVLGGGLLTGGRPHVLGAVLGALVIQTLTVMLQMRGVATEHGLVIKAAVALAICLPQAPKLASRVRRLAGAQR